MVYDMHPPSPPRCLILKNKETHPNPSTPSDGPSWAWIKKGEGGGTFLPPPRLFRGSKKNLYPPPRGGGTGDTFLSLPSRVEDQALSWLISSSRLTVFLGAAVSSFFHFVNSIPAYPRVFGEMWFGSAQGGAKDRHGQQPTRGAGRRGRGGQTAIFLVGRSQKIHVSWHVCKPIKRLPPLRPAENNSPTLPTFLQVHMVLSVRQVGSRRGFFKTHGVL